MDETSGNDDVSPLPRLFEFEIRQWRGDFINCGKLGKLRINIEAEVDTSEWGMKREWIQKQ